MRNRLGGLHFNQNPKRKRVGVFQNMRHTRKYPRACAWGSDFATPSKPKPARPRYSFWFAAAALPKLDEGCIISPNAEPGSRKGQYAADLAFV